MRWAWKLLAWRLVFGVAALFFVLAALFVISNLAERQWSLLASDGRIAFISGAILAVSRKHLN